ncbi:polysaccharide lyase [Corallincola spongiicola]|uniref:Carbohydrate-binding protein n=1 Tax=Corallincola spongiicola TaxID=2520508 RepID=A0ABY1WPP7_9GAMM|nr:carbohydrate-binding domain-containing protein [Corallincola spongiicola]TAA46054.1 carbohydrate-binding protein [Corallincola spongiicola]
MFIINRKENTDKGHLTSVITFLTAPCRQVLTIAALSVLIGMPSVAHSADSCQLVRDINFNNRSGSFKSYTQAMATADFGTLEKNAAGDVRGLDRPGTTWRARNAVGNGVLRTNYPANIAGGTNSGILFDQKFAAADEAVMQYRIKFGENFEWAAGGKLPGLAGGTGRIPVGCTQNLNTIENGFSARLMWRKRGDLVVYTYFPNRLEPRQGNCGIDYKFAEVEDNRWYTIRQYIKLNTPGQKNGVLRMEIDGEVGLDMRDVEYRISGKSSVKINDFIFHTYRGGGANDTRFHSPNNEYIYMDDFKVWTGCSNPDADIPDETPDNPIPAEPETFSCFAAAKGLDDAKDNFASQCSTFARKDCDQLSANGQQWWVCSSQTIDDEFDLPIANSAGVVDIEAEQYARAIDSTAGNKGNAYRTGNVDIQATEDSGGGFNIGWMAAGETLSYDLLLTKARDYVLELRTASARDSGLISVLVDGETRLSNETIDYTGDFQAYKTLTFNIGELSAGRHDLTIEIHNGPFNLNWLRLTPATDEAPSDQPPEESGNCHQYTGSERTELDLRSTTCVDLPANLADKTLQVWDSDTHKQCNFRGAVESLNGNGMHQIDSNYESTTGLSGTRINFNASNGCEFVKMRLF